LRNIHRSSFIIHRSTIQLAFKAALAATIAMTIVELLHLPSSFWAPLSALAVMQTEIGSSLVSSRSYLIASTVGVLLGALIVSLVGSNVVAVGVGIFVVLLLGTWMKLPPGTRVVAAGVLPVIALAASDDPWRYGAYRLADIATGLGSAILVSLLLWPSRAVVTLRRSVADVVRDAGTVVATALTDLTTAPSPPDRMEELRAQMRQRLDTAQELLPAVHQESPLSAAHDLPSYYVSHGERISEHASTVSEFAASAPRDTVQAIAPHLTGVAAATGSASDALAAAIAAGQWGHPLTTARVALTSLRQALAPLDGVDLTTLAQGRNLLRLYALTLALTAFADEIQRTIERIEHPEQTAGAPERPPAGASAL
jgi:uncharacterized membrane protein YccC